MKMLPYMAKRIKATNGIKVTNQLTLKLGDYPRLSGCAQCNHKDP